MLNPNPSKLEFRIPGVWDVWVWGFLGLGLGLWVLGFRILGVLGWGTGASFKFGDFRVPGLAVLSYTGW